MFRFNQFCTLCRLFSNAGCIHVIHERGISDYNDKYDTTETQVIDLFDSTFNGQKWSIWPSFEQVVFPIEFHYCQTPDCSRVV